MKVFLRKIIYFVIGLLSDIWRKDMKVVILAYHSFSSDGWRFSTSVENFKKQVSYLKKNNQFISADDLYAYLLGEKEILKPSVLVTIDDGYGDVLEIKDYLNESGIKPLLFILSNPNETDRKQLDSNKEFLTKNEVMMLADDGWTIGSHGTNHTDFSSLSKAQTDSEIRGSKERLEDELNMKIRYIAYPKGRYNNMIIKEVERAGYRLGFTMDDEIISPNTDRFKIPRVGVDGSHSFFEFTILPTFWAVQFRKMVKKYFSSLTL